MTKERHENRNICNYPLTLELNIQGAVTKQSCNRTYRQVTFPMTWYYSMVGGYKTRQVAQSHFQDASRIHTLDAKPRHGGSTQPSLTPPTTSRSCIVKRLLVVSLDQLLGWSLVTFLGVLTVVISMVLGNNWSDGDLLERLYSKLDGF